MLTHKCVQHLQIATTERVFDPSYKMKADHAAKMFTNFDQSLLMVEKLHASSLSMLYGLKISLPAEGD